MIVYDRKRGQYAAWVRLLNEVVTVAVFTAVVIALLLGVEYSLCVGNW